ncbi:hypothetical protein HNI00_07320 [Thermoleptolyngbya oregonensis NK1-22]|uniref:Uncharacterized protein n=1 Tax=Thermoleptolyngbya oregonensis NK1-22 TaxID=2547457 RepID=A0AA97BCR0_9CYAN|nr:hypothetical protein [Thermoleptolyngbya oregonensis]WOB42986.1 hypothetical protein HNI00_07320 [Thermoleptolyngbya oregonensis NK1-22]
MTKLTKILLENVRSALMIPCDPDAINTALLVQVYTDSGRHITLVGEEAADFWKAWEGFNA